MDRLRVWTHTSGAAFEVSGTVTLVPRTSHRLLFRQRGPIRDQLHRDSLAQNMEVEAQPGTGG